MSWTGGAAVRWRAGRRKALLVQFSGGRMPQWALNARCRSGMACVASRRSDAAAVVVVQLASAI